MARRQKRTEIIPLKLPGSLCSAWIDYFHPFFPPFNPTINNIPFFLQIPGIQFREASFHRTLSLANQWGHPDWPRQGPVHVASSHIAVTIAVKNSIAELQGSQKLFTILIRLCQAQIKIKDLEFEWGISYLFLKNNYNLERWKDKIN